MGASQAKVDPATERAFKAHYSVPDEKYRRMMKLFNRHAKDGVIDRAAFQKIFGAEGMADALAERVFDFAAGGGDTVELADYMLLVGLSSGGTPEEKLRSSFRLFDQNGDGVLTQEEVRDVFTRIIKHAKAKRIFLLTNRRVRSSELSLSPQEAAELNQHVAALFELADTDGNGTLDVEEFLSAFAKDPEACALFSQF